MLIDIKRTSHGVEEENLCRRDEREEVLLFNHRIIDITVQSERCFKLPLSLLFHLMEGFSKLFFNSMSSKEQVQGVEHEYEDHPDDDDFLTIVPENQRGQVTFDPGYTPRTNYGRSNGQPMGNGAAVVPVLIDRSAPAPFGATGTMNGSRSESGKARARANSYVLDDTIHLIKGKGILASRKDVSVDPDEFAAGCKLLQAAALGNLQNVIGYLNLRPNHINFRDYDRRTALHVAASEGKLNIVMNLIEKYNSPINRSDRWGGSALDDAHRHRHSEVIQYLRSKGASTGSTDHTTILITAAATGDLDELQVLLNGIDASSSSPTKGNSKIGKSQSNSNSSKSTTNPILARTKVDINGGDYDGRTALHVAAAGGHVKVCKFLVSKGANVNALDNWGGRPTDDAMRMGRLACIRVLKECGGTSGQVRHIGESSDRGTTKYKEDKNLLVQFSELDVLDKIGAGAFGEIFKCRWRGTLVAAKCIKSTKIIEYWKEDNLMTSQKSLKNKTEEFTEKEVQLALTDFRMETGILRTLRHPNIVMLLGYSTTENFEVMISELMKCSLLDVFKSQMIHRTSMSKKKQILYAQQLARGMNYLHKCTPPVIHRDLKPANLLIDLSGTLKISDFGLAKVRPDPLLQETDKFRMTGETGSYRFMAPEVFRHEHYSETVDVYSFAMIFYYLLAGRPPWEQLSGLKAVIQASTEADRPIVDRSWDIKISGLMQRCWEETPSSRPSFSVILEELHSYSSEYKYWYLHKRLFMPAACYLLYIVVLTCFVPLFALLETALKLDIDNISLPDEGGRSCCNSKCVIS